MKVASVMEMKKLDDMASNEFGISKEILMENAGNAAFKVIEREMGEISGKKFVIFAGTGNNGGDGFVLARILAGSCGIVTVFVIGEVSKIKEPARVNYERLLKIGVEVIELKHVNQVMEIALLNCDAVIDAIFGIGLQRPIEGLYRNIVDEINRSGKTVFSLDIPSGINGDTGEVMGTAIKANYTVTFGLPKLGLFNYPGAFYAGKLYISNISFPKKLTENEEIKVQLNIPSRLPERNLDAHKGDFGKALFISGSKSFLGAPYFSSYSFLKVGGGMSYLAAPQSIIYNILSNAKEVIALPQDETPEGTISYKNLEKLVDFSDKVDVVSMGQGISLNEATKKLFTELVKRIKKPIIIDGDGITIISENPNLLKKRKYPTIITPHVGEFSRLIKTPIDEIKKNRFNIIKEYASKLNAIIVLKGSYSLISDGNYTYINTTGNPGMATAGSGDVLDGVIAFFVGIGLAPIDAARTGAFIHGLSGDIKSKSIGLDGLVSTDILEGLPQAIRIFKESYYDIVGNLYERA